MQNEDFKNIKIDICSDLHIDQWSSKYKIKYPCGEKKNFLLNLKKLIQNI